VSLTARIRGVGLLGPGLAGWAAAREALAGRAPYVPAPTMLPAPEALPATERRRAGKCVKLALATGLEAAAGAGLDPASLATVFASSSGDGENCHAICEALASDDRMISPTRFHNSVHNAPAGYWSIATGATASADCIAAFDASFGAGLLEALARLAAEPRDCVMLLAYDAPYP
jgi:3-oxoacyl-(acyl-carrier-protein) synthase